MHGEVSKLRQGDRLRIHFSWAGFMAIDMMGKTEERKSGPEDSKKPATMEGGNSRTGGGAGG
jgi:hypothetical protein